MKQHDSTLNPLSVNTIQRIGNMLNCSSLKNFYKLLKEKISKPKIISIGFNNFKAFGDKLQVFPKKPITLVYAPNSVGKSSLQHSQVFMQYFQTNHIKQKVVSLNKATMFGDEVDIGGFENYIHKHDTDREIEYKIEIDDCRYTYLKSLKDVDDNFYNDKTIQIEYFFINLLKQLENEDIKKSLQFFIDLIDKEYKRYIDKYSIEDAIGEIRESFKSSNQYSDEEAEQEILHKLKLAIFNIVKIEHNNKIESLKDYIENEYIKNKSILIEPQRLTIEYFIGKDGHESIYSINDSEVAVVNSNTAKDEDDVKIAKELDKTISDKFIQYIGPLRYYPDRDFILEKTCENENSYSSAQLWSLLSKRNTLRKELNSWLTNKDKLKSHYEVIIKEDSETIIVFKDIRTNTEVSHKDLGLGISQVLPVLISSYFGRNKTICIEQPELHLHPAVQAELADEIIKGYKNGNNDFFIETHSEYLLLRLMRRMRYVAENKEDRDKELDIIPNDICLLYIDEDEEMGEVFIRELELGKRGNLLDHWPGGFFEEGYKERFS